MSSENEGDFDLKKSLEGFDLTEIKTEDLKAVDLSEEDKVAIISQARIDISAAKKVGDVLAILEKIASSVTDIGIKALLL